MAVGFYELLQVAPDAGSDAIRAAYQEQVAQVVRKLRAAEARQLDVSPIEARRAALGEAWAVLSDPARRRRYDRFRELSRTGLPSDPEELWAQAGPSLVDPAAAAAVEVVRTLSDLRVGEALAAVPAPPEPEVSPVRKRAAPPPPEPVAEASFEMPAPSIAPAPSPAPARASAAVVRPSAAPAIQLGTIPSEDLARLLDHYGPTGAFLRAVRELRRIPLDNLSGTTRITARFLDAMERDAYGDLPGATFVRGYLKMVVRTLEAIPPGPELDDFVEGYMSRFHRARG
ncbi:MAG: helix-turn-helix domain-containing protein [Myxococcota bacterium]